MKTSPPTLPPKKNKKGQGDEFIAVAKPPGLLPHLKAGLSFRYRFNGARTFAA